MKRIVAGSLVLFPLLLSAVACEKGAAPTPPATPAAPVKPAPVAATQEAEVQLATVTVKDTGYEPKEIALVQGKKTRLVFRQTTDDHCVSQVQIPSMGVPKTDLPKGKDTTVEFTPTTTGNFAFTCGMDMVKGNLAVKAAL